MSYPVGLIQEKQDAIRKASSMERVPCECTLPLIANLREAIQRIAERNKEMSQREKENLKNLATIRNGRESPITQGVQAFIKDLHTMDRDHLVCILY